MKLPEKVFIVFNGYGEPCGFLHDKKKDAEITIECAEELGL